MWKTKAGKIVGTDFITIDRACEVIGGERPISKPTFYRGVKHGRYPAPEHPSPGISRIRLSKLLAAIGLRPEEAA